MSEDNEGQEEREDGMDEEPLAEEPLFGNRGNFDSGPPPGKLGSFMSKMGPILQNKEMVFAVIDNAVLPQLNDILDKYLYGEYMKHKAKYLFSYYKSLTEAGFSREMSEKLVAVQAEKDSAAKVIMEILPEMIDVIARIGPLRKKAEREEYPL